MKRLSIIFLIFVLASCEQNFLERSPIIGITQENFYQTEEDAYSAVNAAYAALQFELSPGGHFRWFWGDIMSDDSQKGGSGDNDAYELLLLETFQGPVNTDLLEGEWSACYEGIYRANTVLEYIPPMEISDAVKNQVLAEAKFIRAWMFYN
ncbi:MAG: RagB/SusD family nutrient uptake outer membrane protein, partial [Saprospiraceae bacterium]|nr:RagB/SusD family nutrient uptake outer membrane protein [Saprospiraceae bacterium]